MVSANVNFASMTPEDDFVAGLIEKYGNELRRYLLRRVGRELVDEVLQETYLQMHKLGAAKARFPERLLFAVGNRMAKRAMRRKYLVRNIVEAEEVNVENVVDPAPQPDQQVVLEEAMQKFGQIVESMPKRLKEVFLMRRLEHLSSAEISRKTGVSNGAVEKRLQRAMTYIQGHLHSAGIDWLRLDLKDT
jgi:RNA polymerase sigma factor (sigma-70 family)